MLKISTPLSAQLINAVKGFGLVIATFLLYWIATLLFCSTCYGQLGGSTSPRQLGGSIGTPPATQDTKSSYLSPYALGMNTQSMGLKALFDAVERINKPDSCQTRTAIGKIGIGAAFQTNGTLFANVTAKTRWGGYATLLVGRKKNDLFIGAEGQYKTNPSVLAGIGFIARPHMFIGGLAGASFYQDVVLSDKQPTRYSQVMKAGKFKPVLQYGLQVSVELRHVWASLNLISGNGIGIGATYFF